MGRTPELLELRSPTFDTLLETHYRKSFKGLVFRYSRHGARDIGEDIVQEAYARALERWEEYDEEYAFATWFELKILPGERINHRRREQKHTSIELNELLEVSVDQERVVSVSTPEQISYARELLRIIANKDDYIREVLHDAFILGENYTVIGYRVRKSANAVGLIVKRFRREMQNEDSVPRRRNG